MVAVKYRMRRFEHVTHLSVAGLLDWCAERDLDPKDVEVTGSHLKWTSDETDEERERREEHGRQSAARQEKWEREALTRFIEKYGVPQ